MKVTALNACRRHVRSLLGIVMTLMMVVTSCKKDEEITPGTVIGAENLRHHRSWNDTIKNSPGAISVAGTASSTGSSTTSGSTTTTGSGTTTTTGSATTTTGSTTTGATSTPVAAKPASGTTTTTGSTTSTTQPAAGTTTTTGSGTTKTTTTTTIAATTTAPVYKTSAAIVLNGKSNVVISGLAVPSISLNNCTNITIRNCKVGPNIAVGIQIYQCTNVIVDSCMISNVSTGVDAIQSQTISVTNCQAKNMIGPFPRGEYVQFNNVSGGGNRVLNNKFENVAGQGDPQDGISMYESNGLATDPIMISGNQIRGGGPSNSGGGIMLGDNGGSYQIAENNTLVDPGQYGMAISGGTNMSIINNEIYGKQQSFTNVGLYYWNQSGKASSNITISGNQVNFTMSDGEQNNTYLPNGSLVPTGWSTNVMNKSLSESLLPATLTSIQ